MRANERERMARDCVSLADAIVFRLGYALGMAEQGDTSVDKVLRDAHGTMARLASRLQERVPLDAVMGVRDGTGSNESALGDGPTDDATG